MSKRKVHGVMQLKNIEPNSLLSAEKSWLITGTRIVYDNYVYIDVIM